MKIKGTDLEKIQKTENKDEVLEFGTKRGYQKHGEYKGLKAKNSGKKMVKQCKCSRHKQNRGIDASR